MAWHYRIPNDVAQPVELHSILLQTVAFENHFDDSYRQFIVTELTGVDTMAHGTAVQMLDRTLYADPTVKNALERVTTDDMKIRAMANRLARQIQPVGETSD
jgi:hypothetical protein